MPDRAQTPSELSDARLRNALKPFVGRFAWVGAYFAALLAIGTWGYVMIVLGEMNQVQKLRDYVAAT